MIFIEPGATDPIRNEPGDIGGGSSNITGPGI